MSDGQPTAPLSLVFCLICPIATDRLSVACFQTRLPCIAWLGARRRPWYRKRGRFQPDSPHVLRACDKRHGAVKQVAFTFPSYCPLTFLHFRCSLAGITDKWLLKVPKLVKIENLLLKMCIDSDSLYEVFSPAVCIDNRKPFPSPFIVV